MTKYNIYIPSKGRAKTCNTPSLLEGNNTSLFLVVEPQDENAYIEEFGENYVLTMEENNKGIAYARNWCKNHSIRMGEKYHWQIDDDINSFSERTNKNRICNGLELLRKVEQYVDEYSNIGIAGLKHSLFAWSAKKEIDYNKQICSCAIINNEVDIKWRDGVVEDTDYSMQVLANNYCSVLFNRFLYDPPKLASNSGGNNASGYYDNYIHLLHGLQEKWKDDEGNDIFHITEKNGRPRMKPCRVWSKFKQRPINK